MLCILINVERTQKSDWFTEYLSTRGLWVGGLVALEETKSMVGVKETIRYFLGSQNTFLVVQILEFDGERNPTIDHEVITRTKRNSQRLETHFTLSIWPKEQNQFSVLHENRYISNISTMQLLTLIAMYDASLIGNAYNLKPINKSYTDYFHFWARKHMKGFQNDIDAYFFVNDRYHLLELKRPMESVRNWRPYRADTQNYIIFSKFCSERNYALTNLAYSRAERGLVKIFKNVEVISNKKLSYDSLIVSFDPTINIMNLISEGQYKKEISNR